MVQNNQHVCFFEGVLQVVDRLFKGLQSFGEVGVPRPVLSGQLIVDIGKVASHVTELDLEGRSSCPIPLRLWQLVVEVLLQRAYSEEHPRAMKSFSSNLFSIRLECLF